MITTLTALAAVCLLSLAFILIIPYFAATKVLMGFLPQDIREAAKAHALVLPDGWKAEIQ